MKLSEVLKRNKLTVAIVTLVAVLLIILVPTIATMIKNNTILSHNNITSEMKQNTNYYLDKKLGDYYMVYLYNSKKDGKVNEYAKQIDKYEKSANALKVYKVDLNKLSKEKVSDTLFIDDRYGSVILVKNGEEDYRYQGNYPIDKMSHK
jgi:hypothetical protein